VATKLWLGRLSRFHEKGRIETGSDPVMRIERRLGFRSSSDRKRLAAEIATVPGAYADKLVQEGSNSLSAIFSFPSFCGIQFLSHEVMLISVRMLFKRSEDAVSEFFVEGSRLKTEGVKECTVQPRSSA
jgi:hypothetical protein